ncbi:glycosyltransferase family 2 protein [Allohahella marinimesophila]|uniref:Glycosyltransferase 2-like domain-containing protein n=1 Tax=Allohahella marinimesophila TaxID=1054972 RepID=A0ABP7P0Y4_9GAMM
MSHTDTMKMTRELKPQIDILLPTYNGERYLECLLESLLAQSFRDWRLIIRDDCSTDCTPAILESFAVTHPEKVFLVRDAEGRLGVKKSLNVMAQHATANYVALCDQDDVWLPARLEHSLQELRLEEDVAGEGVPVLVHSDLQVVDQNLLEISASFWSFQRIEPAAMKALNVALTQNFVTGCTTLFNWPLLKKAFPCPQDAVVHDWWLALVAIAHGRVKTISAPLVQYRQHSENQIGAKEFSVGHWFSKAKDFQKMKADLFRTFTQADALAATLNPATEAFQLVASYASLRTGSAMKRKLAFSSGRYRKHGFARRVATIFVC